MHIGNRDGALLVDYAYGAGRIVVLSDPYIVTNSGIKLNDNLQLAINTLAADRGLIAFDEYHQGKGVTQMLLPVTLPGRRCWPSQRKSCW